MPLVESWDTIQTVLTGLFTNQMLFSKIDEMDIRLRAIMGAIPEAEKFYLLEKKKVKKFDLIMENHTNDIASVKEEEMDV
jgi:urea-proton symporter